jgi:peroxiredoxin Q/BCP
VIVGVSNDTPAKNAKFRLKQDFPFDLLSDEDLSMSVAYGAAADASAGKASRVSYVIDAEGLVEKVYAKVKAGEHPEQVLNDLTA